MFKNAKVGDKVFDLLLQQWGNIVSIDKDYVYPLKVVFNNSSTSSTTVLYTLEGYGYIKHKVPILSYTKIDLNELLENQLPNLEVNAEVIVWDDNGKRHTRHFSHFDEKGHINCFINGETSWTETRTISWDYWDV